jgi:hypothetical protein
MINFAPGHKKVAQKFCGSKISYYLCTVKTKKYRGTRSSPQRGCFYCVTYGATNHCGNRVGEPKGPEGFSS